MQGTTLLMLSAQLRYLDVVSKLLELGADVNSRDDSVSSVPSLLALGIAVVHVICERIQLFTLSPTIVIT